MIKLLSIIGLFFISLNLSAKNYERIDYGVHSEALKEAQVPVFLYRSHQFDYQKDAKIILFLHGRGYARNIGANDSMLEHLDIEIILKNNPQTVFVAPQDIFFHEDSKSIGQDYWSGANGRDWASFLGVELPQFVSELAINGEFKTVLGISMGAHGALSVSQKFSKQYPTVLALSPVFRPVLSEIPREDYDVFVEQSENGLIIKNNIGAEILEDRYNLPKRSFITISSKDFGLDKNNFPSANICWDKLIAKNSKSNLIEINSDPSGHSPAFWKQQILRALHWDNN